MREIKFRGKRYGDGYWVYGSLYQGTKEGEKYSIILNDSGYHLAPPDDRNLAIAFAENEVNVVIPDTIGQFTGLHDKNGKEIYFDDIVRNKYGDIGCVIWFSDWSLRVDWGGGDIHFIEPEWGLEVIGNIHDNPELLNN